MFDVCDLQPLTNKRSLTGVWLFSTKYESCAIFQQIPAQKMKFSIKDLVIFTEEILNGKLYFLYSEF